MSKETREKKSFQSIFLEFLPEYSKWQVSSPIYHCLSWAMLVVTKKVLLSHLLLIHVGMGKKRSHKRKKNNDDEDYKVYRRLQQRYEGSSTGASAVVTRNRHLQHNTHLAQQSGELQDVQDILPTSIAQMDNQSSEFADHTGVASHKKSKEPSDDNMESDVDYTPRQPHGWEAQTHQSCTQTRTSDLSYYNDLEHKCLEWDRLCKLTFTDMIRCCVCGVCELGGRLNSSSFVWVNVKNVFLRAVDDFDSVGNDEFLLYILKQHVAKNDCQFLNYVKTELVSKRNITGLRQLVEEYLAKNDVDYFAAQKNPILVGQCCSRMRAGQQQWRVCKSCNSDPSLGACRAPDFSVKDGQYIKWLLSCRAEERQLLQCVDVGYQFTNKGSGFTGRAESFHMFMAPIVRAEGGVYSVDREDIEYNCDNLSGYGQQVQGNQVSNVVKNVAIYNIGTHKIYQHLRCMMEVPDFVNNSYLSQKIVSRILDASKSRDPLNNLPESQTTKCMSQLLLQPGQQKEKQEQMTASLPQDPSSSDEPGPSNPVPRQRNVDEFLQHEPSATDDMTTGNQGCSQDMVIVPVDPPYGRCLKDSTLMGVGHVHVRDKEKRSLLSRPNGMCNNIIPGITLTLESTLFPYLFPDSLGHFLPQNSFNSYIAEFADYLESRARNFFSPFTLVLEYLMMMYQILRVMMYTTSSSRYSLKLAYEKRRKKYPDESEQNCIKNLITYVIPKTIQYSPSWWRKTLNDVLAVVQEFGLPHYFLTLTVDNTSNLKWQEYKDMESIMKRLNAQLHSPGNKYGVQHAQPEAAQLFHDRVTKFMDMFLLSGHKALGDITHYVTRYEMQGRQAIHAHILLWSTPESVETYQHQITRDIQMELDPNGNLVPPDPARNPTKAKLYDIIKRKQLHTCTGACQKNHGCIYHYPCQVHTGQTAFNPNTNEYSYYCPNYESRNVVSYHPLVRFFTAQA